MAKYIYKLAEIVMFVLSSNPATITRMKKQRKGFFKGYVVRETSKEVWIQPMHKDLAERLEGTSFHRVCAVVDDKKAYLLPENAIENNFLFYDLKEKYGTGRIDVIDIVVVPKKQTEHFYGERRRFQDAMDKLIHSDLVKEHGGRKKKTKKTTDWVYKV